MIVLNVWIYIIYSKGTNEIQNHKKYSKVLYNILGVFTLTVLNAVTVVNSVIFVTLQSLQQYLHSLRQKPWFPSHFGCYYAYEVYTGQTLV